MGAARNEHEDDLDYSSGSTTTGRIYNPSKMVLVGEIGGWHYAYDSGNPWRFDTFWHEPGRAVYSFSFVDGHVENRTIYEGLGVTSSSGSIHFRNFD